MWIVFTFCINSAKMANTQGSNDDWKFSTFSIINRHEIDACGALCIQFSMRIDWKNALQFPQFQELLKKFLSFINFIKSSRQKFHPRLPLFLSQAILLSLNSSVPFSSFHPSQFLSISTPNSFPFTHHCRNDAVSVAFNSDFLRLIGKNLSLRYFCIFLN